MIKVLIEDDILMPLARMGEVQTKVALTVERMDRLVDLIYGRAGSDPNLLIPDSAAAANGTEGSGGLAFPWADLNLTQADVQDASGNYFTYEPHLTQREICFGNDAELFRITSTNPARIVFRTREEAAGRLLSSGPLVVCPF